jgi:hypothetical protein
MVWSMLLQDYKINMSPGSKLADCLSCYITATVTSNTD